MIKFANQMDTSFVYINLTAFVLRASESEGSRTSRLNALHMGQNVCFFF